MLMDHIGDLLERHGPRSYTELRAQQNSKRLVAFLDGDLVRNTRSRGEGVCARVRHRQCFGFASSSEHSPASIKRVLEEADANARFLGDRLGQAKDAARSPLALVRADGLEDEREPSQADLLQFAKAVDAQLAARYPTLKSRQVGLSLLDMEKRLVNSLGVRSHSFTPRTHLYVAMTVEDKDGKPVEHQMVLGGYGSFASQLTELAAIEAALDQAYEELMEKREGVYPEAGMHDVILQHDLAGILAHEAVGHTVEADFVMSGSVGGPMLHQRVGSELIHVVDFAHHAYGRLCDVPVFVDDEGTEAEDAVLIEGGILKNYMHDKESAAHFGQKAQGNARAFSFADEPLIRMRNTCILPGKSRLEEMIASIDQGYFFAKPGNGQADATGEFMFGVRQGYEIRKGKLARPLRDCTISGVAFDVLRSCTMLGDSLFWESAGMCGKKQPIPVGMGGPAVKCRLHVGGK